MEKVTSFLHKFVCLFGIILVLLSPFIIICTATFPDLIATEHKSVKVEIIDTNYQASRTTIVCAGKAFVPRTDPAKYEVIVEYEDTEYVIDDEDMYERYQDMIGKTINATLEIRTHENGQVWYDIIELE